MGASAEEAPPAVAMGELAARARNQEMPESGNALKPKGGRGLVGRIPCAA